MIAAAAFAAAATTAASGNGLNASDCYYLANYNCCDVDPDFRKVCGDPIHICVEEVLVINGIEQNPTYDRAVPTAPLQNGWLGSTLVADGAPVWCRYYEAFCAPATDPESCFWVYGEENVHLFRCQGFSEGVSNHDCP